MGTTYIFWTVRTFITDESFLSTMKDAEKYAWIAFKYAITKFLGKTKDPEYKNIVEKMVRKFKILGCSMFTFCVGTSFQNILLQ